MSFETMARAHSAKQAKAIRELSQQLQSFAPRLALNVFAPNSILAYMLDRDRPAIRATTLSVGG